MDIALSDVPAWYVLQDLKPRNAKQKAYLQLLKKGFEVFTPLQWVVSVVHGKRVREQQPVINDLLFVKTTRQQLDPVIKVTPTLRYRYFRGGKYCEPMIVPEWDMQRFMGVIGKSDAPVFFSPEEISPAIYGRKIRIIGGPFNGYEGSLLTTRGSRVKRLLVQLQGILVVGVEVAPEYIELLEA